MPPKQHQTLGPRFGSRQRPAQPSLQLLRTLRRIAQDTAPLLTSSAHPENRVQEREQVPLSYWGQEVPFELQSKFCLKAGPFHNEQKLSSIASRSTSPRPASILLAPIPQEFLLAPLPI